MADIKQHPFFHGVPVNLDHHDLSEVTHVVGCAADAIRQYARQRYPGDHKARISLTITACMLEAEVKWWAERMQKDDKRGSEDRPPPLRTERRAH